MTRVYDNLERLMIEFAPELTSIEVKVPDHGGAAPSMVSFLPIDRAMVESSPP